jgi:hypothetical protein
VRFSFASQQNDENDECRPSGQNDTKLGVQFLGKQEVKLVQHRRNDDCREKTTSYPGHFTCDNLLNVR